MQLRLIHTESFRLAAIFTALFAAAMLILSALVYLSVETALHDELDQAVAADLGTIRGAYAMNGLREAQEVIGQRMAARTGSDYFLLQQGDTKLAGNLPAMAPLTGPQRVDEGGRRGPHILGRGEFLSANLYVFAGRSLESVGRAEDRIRYLLAEVLAATILIAGTCGAILSRFFLARMDAMTRTCRAIMEGRFGDRIAVHGTRDELDRLAVVINEMLDRIGALMTNLRQVSSDIAHDLRTPLARLRNRLEITARADLAPQDYKTALNGAIGEAEQILSLFAAVLRISQIESGSRRAGFSRQNLRELVQHVADIYAPVAESAGHPFVLELSGAAEILGDRELLVQMFANLIENAIHHTPPGTPIALTLHDTCVTVSDHGPGVPAAAHDRLFDRFFRLEESRGLPGNGLGLALVAAIAELHGAGIALSDNRPGLKCDVRFEPQI